MSAKNLTVLTPSQITQQHFQCKIADLDAILKDIKLTDDKIDEIKRSVGEKIVRDKILGLFKIGEIFNAVNKWNEGVAREINEIKRNYLLACYVDCANQNSDAISKLYSMISDPYGSILYNKMISIVDDSSPDQELITCLAAALANISNSDFKKLFEDHKYALSLIEFLTPQSLAILKDSTNWPKFRLPNIETLGTKVTSDWVNEFGNSYCANKGINDVDIVTRVRYSINDMISKRFIEASYVKEGLAICKLTAIGNILMPYIKIGKE